jgi:hypothetical protein
MDLTIPYTFYPSALPHWIAWTLFLAAILGAVAVGMVRGRRRGWIKGVLVGLASGLGLLVVTILASMVITFFTHDV